jgi:Mechanosensitive ion channel
MMRPFRTDEPAVRGGYEPCCRFSTISPSSCWRRSDDGASLHWAWTRGHCPGAGIGVGFGAETLAKDVISGIFYLLDDALRVGEYIQIGSYKGTVESFGFRSVKLRHHRSPLLSVPFGVLGRSRT